MRTAISTDYSAILDTLIQEHNFVTLRTDDDSSSNSRGQLLAHPDQVVLVDLHRHERACGVYTCLHIFGHFKPRTPRSLAYLRQSLTTLQAQTNLTSELDIPLHHGYSQGVFSLRGHIVDFTPGLTLLEELLTHTESLLSINPYRFGEYLLPLKFKTNTQASLSPLDNQHLLTTCRDIEHKLDREIFTDTVPSGR